jgi:hypothetical protein
LVVPPADPVVAAGPGERAGFGAVAAIVPVVELIAGPGVVFPIRAGRAPIVRPARALAFTRQILAQPAVRRRASVQVVRWHGAVFSRQVDAVAGVYLLEVIGRQRRRADRLAQRVRARMDGRQQRARIDVLAERRSAAIDAIIATTQLSHVHRGHELGRKSLFVRRKESPARIRHGLLNPSPGYMLGLLLTQLVYSTTNLTHDR